MVLDLSVAEKKRLAELAREGWFHSKTTKSDEVLIKKIERSAKKIKPRSAKNKGSSWQKEICEMISRITGIRFDQQDDQCDIHSREMGLSGADVIVRGRARDLFDFDPECKNCNSVSLPEWVRQAKSNSKKGNWVIFAKSPNLEDNIAVVSIETFESMCTAISSYRIEMGD